jgi:signal transduction histidine kinase
VDITKPFNLGITQLRSDAEPEEGEGSRATIREGQREGSLPVRHVPHQLIAAGQAESIDVLIRYYQPLFSPRFAPDRVPRSSCDTTLSAFAQLATLRLNTRRALISLIDRTNQYIPAEATQTLSLQSDSVHNDQDELWFGCTTLPRSRGLCEKALEMLPLSKSRRLLPLIINDLTKDDEFKGRPFVTSRPSLRFYAAMPISTKAGFNIGSLCVMDDKPRDGMSDVEIRFLGDMVITIMAHLEMGRVKEEHRRSEKMVKGLGLFVEGGSTLREGWLEVGNDKAWGQQGSKDGAEAQSNEEHISATKTTGPEVAGQFESLDNPSPLPPPKPAVDTPAMAQAEPAVELRPVLATQRDYDEISTASNLGNQETLSFPTPVSSASATPARTQDASPIRSTGEDQLSANSHQSLRGSTADLQETMLSENLKEMFSRASNIIRECIEVDGTIFLDASIGTFGGHTGESYGRLGGLGQSGSIEGRSQESILSSSEGEHWRTPASDAGTSGVSPAGSYASQLPEKTLADGVEDKTKTCGILGFSTEEKCSLEGDEAPQNYVPAAEAFLQRLLHKYPRGQVFNLGEGGPVISRMNDTRCAVGDVVQDESRSFEEILRTGKPRESSKQTEAKALLQMLPGARTVVLFPLWDSHRERWFAGSFAWTTRSTRVLTRAEDLSYLAAFGNSIMAEVARLDTIAADRAKSDFISSISHELRSPLHGILASVEFLQDTGVDLFQNSMIDTIERCGRTLLDTIQHVLDFAKINNFTKPKRNMRKDERSSDQEPRARKMGLSVDIDVSVITEDVIDAVYAGHEFQGNSSLGVADEASGFPSEGLRRSGVKDSDTIPDQPPDQPALKKERLAIIMDIGWRSNWTFNTQSGALRRVLMNLFGNALKYTDAGWVKISLQSKDIKPIKSQSQQSIITITISDSGRGISQEFLHNQLFTPFSQENSLNPGTGLGLSIVLQIVRSLGGTIDIHSELGVGTEVKVSLTLNQGLTPPRPLALDARYENSVMRVRKKTTGLTLGLVGFDVYSGISGTRAGIPKVEPELSLSLKASLKSMATHWFGMKVTASESWKASPPDIYIANESEPSLESLG